MNYATTIFCGNAIFDSVHDTPFSGYVAVQEDTIVAVGHDFHYEKYCGPKTKVIDCGDGLVMPGFIDSHGHLFFTMLIDHGISLLSSRSEEEAAQRIYAYSQTLPPDFPVVLGFDYDPARWPTIYPTRESLNRLIPDRPVVIERIEGHGAWLNSRALELFHITRDTVPPIGGKIFHDAQGEPTGYLDEIAIHPVINHTVNLLMENRSFAKNWIRAKIAQLNAWGITSISDMHFDYRGLPIELLEELKEEGALTLKFSLAVYTTLLQGDLAPLREFRQRYENNPYLKFTSAKYFYDGSILSNTAQMVEPYSDMPDTCNLMEPDTEHLRREILAANEEGFRIRIHCIGDGAVRGALNIAQECRLGGGNRGERFAIAHIECIHPEDIPRFAELGVIADIHPPHVTLGCLCQADNMYPKKVGPLREKYCFNYRALVESGARIACGADNPAEIYNPLLGVYRGVTRRYGDDTPREGWIPEQRLTMAQILKGYTIGSAYLDYQETETGTLEAGKKADIIVLDQNLFTLDPSHILKTQVRFTMVDGRMCHSAT